MRDFAASIWVLLHECKCMLGFFFLLLPCFLVCLCFLCVFAVCVCPQRAAGKAWHVALTGLSSINGSALGLNEEGGEKEGRRRHTNTARNFWRFYSGLWRGSWSRLQRGIAAAVQLLSTECKSFVDRNEINR